MDDFIQVLMAVATLVVSIFAIILSVKISKDSHKITLVAKKRSDRIEKLRNYSAAIIASAECAVLSENEEYISLSKMNLIKNVRLFVAQLQYIYPYDIQIIDDALIIKEMVINSSPKDVLMEKLTIFWKRMDLYIGTEYERLKKESTGELGKSGAVDESINTFDDIYRSLETAASQYEEIK